jgi:hypothetical protein
LEGTTPAFQGRVPIEVPMDDPETGEGPHAEIGELGAGDASRHDQRDPAETVAASLLAGFTGSGAT